MKDDKIIIVGAGASGLLAAYELVNAGRSVLILEARNRIGGRIFSTKDYGFTTFVEGGAEFIHTEQPLTISLLEKAGVSIIPWEGKTYQFKNNKLNESIEFSDDFFYLIEKLFQLEKDIPFSDFLNIYLSDDKYKPVRDLAIKYASGYDAADVDRVSSFALRDEWKSEATSESSLLADSYIKILELLYKEIKEKGCEVLTSTIVKKINWKRNHVEVISSDARTFTCNKILITAPLGVLMSSPDNLGYINFSPELTEQNKYFNKLGFGNVIKVISQFKYPFWEKNTPKIPKHPLSPGLGFLLSDTEIGTFWPNTKHGAYIIASWIAGPVAAKMKNLTDAQILNKVHTSLSMIYDISPDELKGITIAERVFNWTIDPFCLGAYAYNTIESKEAIEEINKPVEDTIYFSGEALYEGTAMGTIEAAFCTGKEAAKKITAD